MLARNVYSPRFCHSSATNGCWYEYQDANRYYVDSDFRHAISHTHNRGVIRVAHAHNPASLFFTGSDDPTGLTDPLSCAYSGALPVGVTA